MTYNGNILMDWAAREGHDHPKVSISQNDPHYHNLMKFLFHLDRTKVVAHSNSCDDYHDMKLLPFKVFWIHTCMINVETEGTASMRVRTFIDDNNETITEITTFGYRRYDLKELILKEVYGDDSTKN